MWERFGLLDIDRTSPHCRGARNICVSTLHKSRCLYEVKLVKESIEYPKCLNSYIHPRTQRRECIPASCGEISTSSVVQDDYGEARIFSNYFSNVYIVEMSSPPVHTTPYMHCGHCDHWRIRCLRSTGQNYIPSLFSSSETGHLWGHSQMFANQEQTICQLTTNFLVESSESGIYYTNMWLKLYLPTLLKESWNNWETIILRTNTGHLAFRLF